VSISGSCLCGGVQFEIAQAIGPSEICHCTRCRKKSGATSLELIHTYEAPILNRPPAYVSHFCTRCGGPVPPPSAHGETVEIPVGLFDDDPGVQPDKHIFVDFMPSWQTIRDSLPQLNLRDLIKHRFGRDLPNNYQVTDHNGAKRSVSSDPPQAPLISNVRRRRIALLFSEGIRVTDPGSRSLPTAI